MARKQYSDEDVLKLLREIEVHMHGGLGVVAVCWKAGVSDKTHYAVLLDVMSDGDPDTFSRRKSWYEEFGFQGFATNKARMFITIKQVKSIIEQR